MSSLELICTYSPVDPPQDAGALLMIAADGLEIGMEAALGAVRAASPELLQLQVARTQEEVAALWAPRHELPPVLRQVAPNKLNEDVVVPVASSSSSTPTAFSTRRRCFRRA